MPSCFPAGLSLPKGGIRCHKNMAVTYFEDTDTLDPKP